MTHKCKICSSITYKSFGVLMLGKYDADFFHCKSCGYLYTPNPTWLVEAYTKSIAQTDTGILSRNLNISKFISIIIYFLANKPSDKKYIDVAGGYGLLTRLMRDIGFDFYWCDKYSNNLVASGFEYSVNQGSCFLATAIEVLEHVENPLEFLVSSMDLAGSDVLIFTTELYKGTPPNPNEWWYYSFITGQHISFYSKKTLEVIAEKLGLFFFTSNGIHILSKYQLNQLVLQLVSFKLLRSFLFFYVKSRMTSKSLADHNFLLDKLRSKIDF